MNKGSAILKFAENSDGDLLELPLSMLMQTIFIGGNKGAGKTSALKRLFEAAHRAGAQCGAIAPLGRWWSLRIGKDGKSRGLRNVFVFGGKHGDVPIDRSSGRAVARTVVQKRIHFVLDVELMRKDDRSQFLGDFLEELWQLKKEEDASHPFVLFIDEAQTIAPQKSTDKGVNRMREFAADLCREGRNHGIGMVLGAQRSANVDKDLLALVEMLIVMRTIHHLDRKVYQLWVDEKGDKDDDEGTWLKRLRRFEKGQAYIYAPELNIFERIRVLMPDTFDATRTAVLGEKIARVGKLSQLDVRKLGDTLTRLVEEQSANDPRALKAKVIDLMAKLADLERRKVSEKPAPKISKVTVRKLEQTLKRVEKVITHLVDITPYLTSIPPQCVALENAARALREALQIARTGSAIPGKLPIPGPVEATAFVNMAIANRSAEHRLRVPMRNGTEEKTTRVNSTMRLMLAVLRRRPSTRDQLATLVGKAKSGTFDTYLSRLRGMGHIHTLTDGRLATTDLGGQEAADSVDLAPGAIVMRHDVVNSTMMKMIEEIRVAGSITRDQLAEKIGMARSGTFDTYLSRLSGRGLIVKENGALALSELIQGVA